ncbi:hypothetical protein AU381_16680 [Sinorhizobium glycinis]|uniref:Uncharacterized protein n=1 Tax=Sinorhizobium glycinis TaxID=1472378 RepID=A0A178XKR7_9HYPH|nr:hypothetical protein AU381_16680 [Sinorhizobium glycinis]
MASDFIVGTVGNAPAGGGTLLIAVASDRAMIASLFIAFTFRRIFIPSKKRMAEFHICAST